MTLSQDDKTRVSRLRKLDICAISDAMDRLGYNNVVTNIRQQSGNGRIAGIVTTLKVGIGDIPQGPPIHLGCRAIEASDENNVIIVEQRGGIDAGCWGGLLTLGAKMRNVAGVIADGPIRDIDEAIAYNFPIFGNQLTAKTARGRVVELGTNVPIAFHGLRVNAGDFVAADKSGIAIIPANKIDETLETAEMIVGKEALMAKALLDGIPISQVMGGNYENMLKG